MAPSEVSDSRRSPAPLDFERPQCRTSKDGRYSVSIEFFVAGDATLFVCAEYCTQEAATYI